jgi:hypothetical protein
MAKPKPSPPTSTADVSPKRSRGVTTKSKADPQKQTVTKLCQALLGESLMSDNTFTNCQHSITKLQLLQADILTEVPWAKDVTVQYSFIGLTGLLLREYQKQKSEIERIVTTCNEQRRLMEYKGKQIKELQNKHQIQILAKEEENHTLVAELNHLISEKEALHKENKQLLELTENYQNQLQITVKSKEQENLKPFTCKTQQNNQISNQTKRPQSTSTSESVSCCVGHLTRETTKTSLEIDSSPCVSLASFANTGISTVSSDWISDRETSDMTALSFANSTQSEEIQTSCLLCSNESNTTQVFLCIQCINDKMRKI